MPKEHDMSTFKVGDRVSVAHKTHARFGEIGVVEEVDRFGIDVMWPSGRLVSYSADCLTLAAPPSPRYVVKRAEEMREGEPTVARLVDKRPAGQNKELAERFLRDIESGRHEPWTMVTAYDRPDSWFVVDLHDSWHLANTASPPAPIAPPPPAVTDREVCAAWEAAARTVESGWITGVGGASLRTATVHVGSSVTVFADYRAARSRELRRLADEAREKERRVVLGPIDEPEYA